eukprot:c9936_g1_i3.p1 GENE.c9936_g1_i3~~c9936_g1_i3.p1  ORF type:complete len:141 (+),score=22.01 c9936_g1_i3:201-623(+)
MGIITVSNRISSVGDVQDDKTEQLLQALPRFEPFLWMSNSDPLAIKQWDPNALISTIVGMQNFARVWALQISHRQAHIAQHMLATSDLATRTFTNAAQQSSQLKQSQTQFSSCKFPVIDPSMPCQCSDDNFWSQWTKQSS